MRESRSRSLSSTKIVEKIFQSLKHRRDEGAGIDWILGTASEISMPKNTLPLMRVHVIKIEHARSGKQDVGT